MSIDLGRDQIAVQLSWVGMLMMAVFAITVIGVVIPPRIMDPAWQLRVIAAVVGNGTIPLVGFLMLPIAVVVDPANRRLQSLWHRLRTWALVPVIGYALLIPLQGVAIGRGLQNAALQQNRQLATATARISELRTALQQSTTTAELGERLKAMKAPDLSPAALNQPLPVLRREMEASLRIAETQLRRNSPGLPLESIWALVQNGIREMLTSLLYALAFACLAYRPATPLSLLEEWKTAWTNRRRRAKARAKERQEAAEAQPINKKGKPRRKGQALPGQGRRDTDLDYLRRISKDDDQ